MLATGAAARSAFSAAREEWRLLTAAALTGLARRALEIAADYANARIQFDRPIGAFQGIAHPLADSATASRRAPARAVRDLVDRAARSREAAARIARVRGGGRERDARDRARAARARRLRPLARVRHPALLPPREGLGARGRRSARRAAASRAERLWDGSGAAPSRCPTPAPARSTSRLGADAERVRRGGARASSSENLTPELRAHAHFSWDGHDPDFQRELARAGLLFPSWPREYGGRESSRYENAAFREEFQHAGWTTHAIGTTGMVGAPLITFASEELKREVLPRIARGDAICASATPSRARARTSPPRRRARCATATTG